MSPRTDGDRSPAPVSPVGRISSGQLAVLTLPAIVLVIFVLVLIYQPMVSFTILGLVSPDAVQASVAFDGQALASQQITDSKSVADLYAQINRLPVTVRSGGCGPGFSNQVTYTYTFSFTRSGVLIEIATTAITDGCDRWWELRRAGWQEMHMDLSGTATKSILAEVHLPPPPSQP